MVFEKNYPQKNQSFNIMVAEKHQIDLPDTNQNIQDVQLSECVRKSIRNYLEDLNGEEVSQVYEMVLQQVEKPLFEAIMKHSNNNQSMASRILGINRNTLRKKLNAYNL